MVRNLSEAISLFNSHSSKLHLLDLKPIEDLISPHIYRDPHFLSFSEKFGPIMTHCSKLFSLLRNEQFINNSSIQDCERVLKIFQQSNNLYKHQKFLDLYTDKLLKSPTPHQTAPRIANLINFYNQFNILPKETLLKYLSGDFFRMNSRRKFCVTEALFGIYANLRLSEFKEYKMYMELFDKIIKREIPNALKYESDIQFPDKINLCYSLSISDAWKYTEIWNSILGNLAEDISKEATMLEEQQKIKLLRSLDGIQSFAPDLILRNKEAIYEIYKNLHFDSESLAENIPECNELNVLIKKLNKMNIHYEVNKVLESHYFAQIVIDSRTVVNTIDTKKFIRNTAGERTELEIGGLKYENRVLSARGYKCVSIPEYKLKTYGHFYAEKIIQDNILAYQ